MSASAHGHTPAAWTGVTITFIGFCVAGAAVVMANLPLMWVGFGVVLLGGVVGKVMQMMGMGKTQPNPPLRTQSPAAAARAADEQRASTGGSAPASAEEGGEEAASGGASERTTVKH
ncbi:hypothetical protein GCM10027168_46700 [Streptomyces capparidis]